MLQFRRRIRSLSAFSLSLTWFAGLVTGLDQACGNDDGFEVMIAPATDESPRNSEGDLTVLRDGSLLAAWTEFYGGARDDSAARISAKRSRDGGRTWGPSFTLRENSGRQNVMSASFLRLDNGDLLLFYLEKHSTSDLDGWVVRSNDDGKTWNDPVLITPEDGYFVMNNARVIQLNGGRIVAPFAYTPQVWKKGNVFTTICYYSDDLGKSWRRGQGECVAPKRGAMEPGLIEKADGSVLQIIRTQMGHQWYAESKDRCETWSDAQPWTIVSPEAPATLSKFPDAGDWLVIHNPTLNSKHSHGGSRTPLVAAVSMDEGMTWLTPKPIESNPRDTYSYVSIDFHQGRALLTYYVRHGDPDSPQAGKISWKFKSLPISWFSP
jgi:sialidase-1